MTEIRFLITAKDCLFSYDIEYSFNEVVASPNLIEQKIQELHKSSSETLLKFARIDFDFFAFCPDLFQATMAFNLDITSPVEFAKYKLKYPEDYSALTELASYYQTLKHIIQRPDHNWVVVDREMNSIDPFKQTI